MILLADHVSTFLARNRMYEVLGLFILYAILLVVLNPGKLPVH